MCIFKKPKPTISMIKMQHICSFNNKIQTSSNGKCILCNSNSNNLEERDSRVFYKENAPPKLIAQRVQPLGKYNKILTQVVFVNFPFIYNFLHITVTQLDRGTSGEDCTRSVHGFPNSSTLKTRYTMFSLFPE